MGKAKSLGLKMARLPLDKYLQWGSGSGKSLTLNQMTNIMLDMKTYNNWDRALKHIPKRKLFFDKEKNYNDNRTKYNEDDIPESEIVTKNNWDRTLKHIPKRKLFYGKENSYNDNRTNYNEDDIPENENVTKNNYRRVGFDKSETRMSSKKMYNTNFSGQTVYRDKTKKFDKKIIIPDLFDK